MPIYEYRCKKCGKVFEYKQRMSDAALTVCPEEICDSPERGQVERMISSNVGVVFKGSGFYQTDYKPKSSPNPHKPTTETPDSNKKDKPTDSCGSCCTAKAS
jgi:putative FmdB family regulatory protein